LVTSSHYIRILKNGKYLKGLFMMKKIISMYILLNGLVIICNIFFTISLSILLLETIKTENNALDIDAIYNLKLKKKT
jgi:hypothetical protein